MKVSQAILWSFVIVVVLFCSASFINHRKTETLLTQARDQARLVDVVRLSERFQRNFVGMVSNLQGYLFTGQRSFMQGYDSCKSQNEEILAELKASFPEGSDERIILDDIQELEKYWVDEFAIPLREAKWQVVTLNGDEQDFEALYNRKRAPRLDEDVQKSLAGKFEQLVKPDEATTDRAELYPVGLFMSLLLAASLIGLGTATWLAFYLPRRFDDIYEMVWVLAAGNYDARLSDRGNDELASLSRSLNGLAARLKASFETLRNQKDNMEQFSYTVSHDLCVPLRGINNLVTWIDEEATLPGETKTYLKLMSDKVRRAENILKAIFVYMRAGREGLIKEMVDVNQLLEEIRDDVVFETTIRLEIEPRMPELYTERIPLLQVFTNLIANAFSHHDKKKDGYVRVYHQPEGDLIRFLITDNGPGIDPRYYHKIFRPFETLYDGHSSEHLGIGLAIVKKILDDKQMQINVSSSPAEGTTFSFTWPQAEI